MIVPRVGLRAVPVAVVSPHPVIKAGLNALLARHPERVQRVSMRAASQPRPQVVLVDAFTTAHGPGGEADLARLARSDAALVVVSESWGVVPLQLRHRDAPTRMLAVTADEDTVLSTVESSVQLPRAAASAATTAGSPVQTLTAREVDVLRLISRGLSNQDIADTMFVSINSVKTYIRSAYRRMGVESRSQAVAWCFQHGLHS